MLPPKADGMIKQQPLTLLTPVKPEKLQELNALLEKIKFSLQTGTDTEFKKAKTIHYARWVIVSRDSFRDPPAVDAPVRLILSTNFDGNEEDHLTELATEMSLYIDDVYSCCVDYPEQHERNSRSRVAYLKKWRIDTSAFFVGAPWRSVQQIYDEDALRDHIWEFINKNKWDGKPAKEIHQAIRKDVESRSTFSWSKEKAPVKKVEWHFLIPYFLLVLVILPFIVLWALYIFLIHEQTDKNGTLTLSLLSEDKIRELEKDEDLFPQNQFTQIAVMKPGLMRKLNFKIWMIRTRVLAGHMFVKGKLLNIPTIHFARWVLFDNDKHVLFFSNFDGSWQQYLGDFIDQSGWGLSGIFSNTVNFPKTTFMVTGGAYDEEHFLAWSRSTQVPTQVWYCAYPHLSIKNINNNTAIRNDLYKNLNENEARLFLKRF